MTMPRSTRGSYAKSEGRRQEIVSAAIEVFAATGFHKGSLREVADRVGLSQAGLLHHFPSKERLLQAVLSWRDDDSLERLGSPLPEGVDLFRGYVRLAEHNTRTPELMELHTLLSAEGTSADHPLHDYFVNRNALLLEITLKALEHAQAHGQLKPDVDCHSAARSLMAIWDGLQVQWLLHRGGFDISSDLRRYIQTLITVQL